MCTTSAQRLRRWSNIVQILYNCFVFAGRPHHNLPRHHPLVYLLLNKHETLNQHWINVSCFAFYMVEEMIGSRGAFRLSKDSLPHRGGGLNVGTATNPHRHHNSTHNLSNVVPSLKTPAQNQSNVGQWFEVAGMSSANNTRHFLNCMA